MDGNINLKVIQKYDKYCTEILDKSGRTALYLFHPKDNEWNKTKTEGVLFFYKRSLAPFYAFMILNIKMSSANQIEFITKDLQLQLQLPFLLYKNQLGNIHSVWFYSEEDCSRIATNIGRYVRESGGNDLKIGARKPPPSGNTPTRELPETNFHLDPKGDLQSSTQLELIKPGSVNSISSGGGLDLISMLAKAKQDYQTKPSGDQIKQAPYSSSANKPVNSRPIDLKDLFASSNTQIPSNPPSSHSSRNATVLIQGTPSPAANQSRNFLQSGTRTGTTAASAIKDSSHDGGGMTLEQLERLLVSQNSDSLSHDVYPNLCDALNQKHVTPSIPPVTPKAPVNSTPTTLTPKENAGGSLHEEDSQEDNSTAFDLDGEFRVASSMSQIFKTVMLDSTRLQHNLPAQEEHTKPRSNLCSITQPFYSTRMCHKTQNDPKNCGVGNNKEALLDLLDKITLTAQNVPSPGNNNGDDDDDNEILTPSMLASRTDKALGEYTEKSNHHPASGSGTSNSIASSSLSGHLVSDPHSEEGETLVTHITSKKSGRSKPSLDGLHLTKDQLKESLIHLLQEDESFLNKIHTAYLQTLEKRLNHQ